MGSFTFLKEKQSANKFPSYIKYFKGLHKQKMYIFQQQNINFPNRQSNIQPKPQNLINMIKSQLKKKLSPKGLVKTPNKEGSVDDRYLNKHEKQNSSQQHKNSIENIKVHTPTKGYRMRYHIYGQTQTDRLNKTADGRININNDSKQSEQQEQSGGIFKKNRNNKEQKYEQAQIDKKQQRHKMKSRMWSKIKQMGDIVTSISSKYNYTPRMAKNSNMDHCTDYKRQIKQQNRIKNNTKLNITDSRCRQSKNITSMNKTLYEITNRGVQSKIITEQSQHLQQLHYEPSNDEQQIGYSQSARNHEQIHQLKYKQKQVTMDKYMNDITMHEYAYTQLVQDDGRDDSQYSYHYNDTKTNPRDRSSSKFKIKERQAQHRLQAQNIDTMHMRIHGLLSHIKMDNSKDQNHRQSHNQSIKQDKSQQKYHNKTQNKVYSKTSKINIHSIVKQKPAKQNRFENVKIQERPSKRQLFKQELSLRDSDCDKQIHADLIRKYMQKIENSENKGRQTKYKYYYNSKEEQKKKEHKYCYDSKHEPQPKPIRTKTKPAQSKQPSKERRQKRMTYLNEYNNLNSGRETNLSQMEYSQPVQSYVKQFKQQDDTGYVNMEYVDLINSEIARIKQRIENSEKITKQMQSKYLNTQKCMMMDTINENHMNSELNSFRKINNQNMDYLQLSSDRTKNYEPNQQIINQINIQRWRNQNKNEKYQEQQSKIINYSDQIEYAKENKCLTPKYQYKEIARLKDIQNVKYEHRNVQKNPFKNDYSLSNSTQIIDKGESMFDNSTKNTKKGGSIYRSRNEISCRLASILIQQVEIDQKLRQYREMFHHLSIAEKARKPGKCISRQLKQDHKEQKWTLLKHRLMELQYAYSEEQLQEELEISPCQTDPFHSHRPEPSCNSKIVINKLAQLFVKSQQYWASQVVGCLREQEQRQSEFEIYTLDLNQKGYISIEDIVCFINLYTGKHYRNRDIAALFRRFSRTKENRTSYQAIEEILYYKFL